LPAAPLDFLTDDAYLTIAHFHRLGGGPVLDAILGEAPSHEDALPNVVEEIAPRGSTALKSDDGHGLKRPGFHGAARVFYIHVKISVRILPFDGGEGTGEVGALGRVKFRGER
jgi:hypothetical protein